MEQKDGKRFVTSIFSRPAPAVANSAGPVKQLTVQPQVYTEDYYRAKKAWMNLEWSHSQVQPFLYSRGYNKKIIKNINKIVLILSFKKHILNISTCKGSEKSWP